MSLFISEGRQCEQLTHLARPSKSACRVKIPLNYMKQNQKTELSFFFWKWNFQYWKSLSLNQFLFHSPFKSFAELNIATIIAEQCKSFSKSSRWLLQNWLSVLSFVRDILLLKKDCSRSLYLRVNDVDIDSLASSHCQNIKQKKNSFQDQSVELRQDPLDLSFWSFFTFLHHRIEKVKRHLFCENFIKKSQRKSWSNVPPKLLTCIGFLYKVVHKNGRLRKFNRAREIEFKAGPPPPLWFGFLVLFDFFAPWYGIEDIERHLLWKFHKKFKGKIGQMCHRSCSLAYGFYTKLCTKMAVSKSSIALARLNLTFLPLALSLWNLAHLFIMFMATNLASDFLIFAYGLSYGLSKSKKRGKSSLNFERS